MYYNLMRCFYKIPISSIFILGAILILQGCNQIPGGISTDKSEYIATIVDVKDARGDHYTPQKGYQALYYIRLRLKANHETHEGAIVKLMLSGLYSIDEYGGDGDLVKFDYAGHLPLNREIWFHQLERYMVINKHGEL